MSTLDSQGISGAIIDFSLQTDENRLRQGRTRQARAERKGKQLLIIKGHFWLETAVARTRIIQSTHEWFSSDPHAITLICVCVYIYLYMHATWHSFIDVIRKANIPSAWFWQSSFSLPRARPLPSTGIYICVTGRTQQSLMTRTASSTEEFSLCSAQLFRSEREKQWDSSVCAWLGAAEIVRAHCSFAF